ncbi:MAG: accessory factor UbiK family protein [Pseudomonadales bacterium]|jgi:BMFP domain-containing protein YqiC|nr:accessory factor UbiK family protein [Pseudomonadales bacterium]
MIDNDFLRTLSTKAATLLPLANEAKEKAERELFDLLHSALKPLNLVSRDEFLAQTQLLARAQTRLTELERRLEALEAGKNP